MRRISRLLMICGCCIAAALPIPASAISSAPENELREAVLFNLLMFVDWPQRNPQDGAPIRFCTVDDATPASSIRGLDGREVRGRRLAVRRIDRSLGDLHKCDVVFIDAANRRQGAAIAAGTRQQPILVIAEDDNGLQYGAIIAISVAGGHFVFDVNHAAAQAAGLSISSKLLRLARQVIH